MSSTHPNGLAKSFLLGVGTTVPVDDADEADEESSSKDSGSSPMRPFSSSSSSSSSSSLKTSALLISIFFFAHAFCKSLILSAQSSVCFDAVIRHLARPPAIDGTRPSQACMWEANRVETVARFGGQHVVACLSGGQMKGLQEITFGITLSSYAGVHAGS